MFENVNYNFYSDTLGRSVIPTETDFEKYALEEKLFIKSLVDDGIITGERIENGIDTAICMMIEIDYSTQTQINGSDENGGAIASESINGYSYSVDRTLAQEESRLNAKSASAKKFKWIEDCCFLKTGWWQ